MKAMVDQETCTGCGACAGICPEVFTMEGDAAAVKADPVPEDAEQSCLEAEDNCPVDAIQVEE